MSLWNPWSDLLRWPEEQSAPERRTFRPAVDIVESDSGYELHAELPGMRAEDIDIDVDGRTLTLKAQRQFERESEKAGYRHIERRFGTFQRTFTLPEHVDTDAIRADLKDGVLMVTLPKTAESKPRRIAVGSGEQKQAAAKSPAPEVRARA